MINIQVLPRQFQEKFRYDRVDDFYEDRACVEKNCQWFHINSRGRPAYTARYELVEYFQGGLAWAKKNGKWIRINKKGKLVQQKSTSSVV